MSVKARSLVLCSVLIFFLITLNGCYTVFRRGTLDGKPPAGITEREEGSSSVDVAFESYEQERWRYYLSCPWWYQSIWFESAMYGHDEAEYDSDMTPDYVPPAVAPVGDGFEIPGYIPVRQSQPNSAPETRMKDSNSVDTTDTATKKEEPAKKPERRGGGGGR